MRPRTVRAFGRARKGTKSAEERRALDRGRHASTRTGGVDPSTFWVFSRKTEAIARKPAVRLPDDEADHASFFVYDGEKDNELSSSEEEAKGLIEVLEWGCRSGDKVRIAVAATLDSEFHDAPGAKAEGEINAVIGDSLPIPD